METLGDIWTELCGRVRAFIGHRVNDPNAADDIAQEVMLKVQSQLHALPPEDRLPAWVFTIAHARLRDAQRKLGRLPVPVDDEWRSALWLVEADEPNRLYHGFEVAKLLGGIDLRGDARGRAHDELDAGQDRFRKLRRFRCPTGSAMPW